MTKKANHQIVQTLRYRASQTFSTSSLLAQTVASPARLQTNATPKSAERQPQKSKTTNDVPIDTASTAQRLAAEARKRLPSVTETYVAYGVTEKLIKECGRQAAYSIPQRNEKDASIPKTKDGEDLGVGNGWWYESKTECYTLTVEQTVNPDPALGLTPTFNTWAQVTFLHMYLLTVRMRCFPAEHAPTWHQHLLNHFFYTAEDRMVTIHNVHSRAIRNKYLKDLFVQWRGLLAGYDEGLIRGDAVLATAIWRNVFKADENVDFRHLGEVVSYMRGVLKGLDGMKDDAIAGGEVVFGDPGTERAGVMAKSGMMASLDEPLPGKPELKNVQAAR